MATYKGRPLGSIGHASAVSFHETKNVTAGEGGALIVNRPEWTDRAEILWEKGTNRTLFARGKIAKYRWIDLGSSFLPSEISAAFLWAQLEHADRVTGMRLGIWSQYHRGFEPLESAGLLRRPIVPADCTQNGHMYYILLAKPEMRANLLEQLNQQGVNAVSHYVPLHTALGGQRFGRPGGSLEVTESIGDRLVRLPLFPSMTDHDVAAVVDAVIRWAGTVG